VSDLERSIAFYEDFSHRVLAEDWRRPNWRHEQLRLFLVDWLGRARGLQILDVGCGAGVMASHLSRFGAVTGIDLSEPSIEMARRLVPGARFETCALEQFDSGDRFDLITLFDVFEHVPEVARPAFVARIGELLAPDGMVLLSTPHPSLTRWLHEQRNDLMQEIEDPVEPATLVALAAGIGREFVRYATYQVDAVPVRQYQAALLAPAGALGAEALGGSMGQRAVARLTAASNPVSRRIRTLLVAWRALRRHDPVTARWLLEASGPAHPDEPARR
jgi:2-polyprenyl-3-methyl-5-hydroxy-6-metoxy-1,4-benzoquinol methylase